MAKLSTETKLFIKLVKARVENYQFMQQDYARASLNPSSERSDHIGKMAGSIQVLQIMVDIVKEMEGK